MSGFTYETESGKRLQGSELLDSFVLHIPHAAVHLPSMEGFLPEKVEENLLLLTDWATDRIFDVGGVEKIIAPFSRLFCDVERFEDAEEPMVEVGRGFFYTHGYDGSALRKADAGLKDAVYRDYYLRHHERFYALVRERLERYGVCHVVDCHSFNDNPLVPFIEQPKSPDICIGTDPFHTPDYLLDYTLAYFTGLGYAVEINNPYAGCIIPKPYFRRNSQVKGIMIEVNKRLYMDGFVVNEEKVEGLRGEIDHGLTGLTGLKGLKGLKGLTGLRDLRDFDGAFL